METMIKETAKDLGFIPKYVPMTHEQTLMFIGALGGINEEEYKKNIPFSIQILDKRIEALKLPITFTIQAKVLAMILTDGNPGKMMTVLIDALTRFENKEIDSHDITRLYAIGFDSDESFQDYVETYIKTKKIKWSEIY